MLKSILVGSYSPSIDGINGSFNNIIKKSPNLKRNFVIEHNSEGDTSSIYERFLYFNYRFVQSWNKSSDPFFSISFKRHYMQITDFVIGEPTNSCFSTKFRLYGTDLDNNEMLLGEYLSSDYNFCGNDSKCIGNGTIPFEIKEKTSKLIKSLKFVSLSSSCSPNHFAVKGVDVYGNLYQRYLFLTVRCRKSFPQSIFLIILLIIY